jgi:hypothetical protein
MKCIYCDSDGVLRATKQDGVSEDTYVCKGCWKLLQDPKTALPLIRGHLTLALRGKTAPSVLQKRINEYMDLISKWKPRN